MYNKRILILLLSGFPVLINAQAKSNAARDIRKWETVIDGSSFKNENAFAETWNMFYPWGTDHNGSARMYKEQVVVNNGVLKITAVLTANNEGKSSATPHLAIKYHSGAVHAKHQINITKEYPEYRVYGEFKAPVTQGTWPAFWLTAVNGWPPETDILEFKGDSFNWQNTFITPKDVTTVKQNVPDSMEQWHSYEAVLKRIDNTRTTITYYFDGKKQGEHDTNFTNKPMWLIINLQMEGSSGTPGPGREANYFARKVMVQRIKAQK
ncbi:MAG: family 16 glycosylhydrolase [Bacteroidia bacterium]